MEQQVATCACPPARLSYPWQTENLCYYRNQDGSLTPGYSLGQGE